MGCLSVLSRFSRKGNGIEYKPRRNLLFSFSGGKKRPEKFAPGKKFNIVTQERAAQYTGRLTNYFHLLVSNSTKTSTQSHTFQGLVSERRVCSHEIRSNSIEIILWPGSEI